MKIIFFPVRVETFVYTPLLIKRTLLCFKIQLRPHLEWLELQSSLRPQAVTLLIMSSALRKVSKQIRRMKSLQVVVSWPIVLLKIFLLLSGKHSPWLDWSLDKNFHWKGECNINQKLHQSISSDNFSSVFITKFLIKMPLNNDPLSANDKWNSLH